MRCMLLISSSWLSLLIAAVVLSDSMSSGVGALPTMVPDCCFSTALGYETGNLMVNRRNTSLGSFVAVSQSPQGPLKETLMRRPGTSISSKASFLYLLPT